MLSDRRLCLALDEPQLCNGHMGVRAGKELDLGGTRWWGVMDMKGMGQLRNCWTWLPNGKPGSGD